MMRVIETVAEMAETSRHFHLHNKRIGFVPTMGYLHEGHLSLMRMARQHSDVLFVSIFVNPSQFAAGEDFEKYPRDFGKDQTLCRQEGVDILFYPSAREMYKNDHRTYVITDQLAGKLCGRSRPGHFQGVTTVVAKLFNIVQPDVSVFGQKDAQQALIIRRMVEDLNFPVRIINAPIVREGDGLAMSSRNKYLTPELRTKALVLSQALRTAEQMIRNGEKSSAVIEERMRGIIGAIPEIRLDYLTIVDYHNLEPVPDIKSSTLIALAAYAGNTRLIDNVLIDLI
jgi:pantoate--beta-alanine ligase